MTPYCTIHAAPLDQVLLGISMDLPRYYGEIQENTPMARPKTIGGITKHAADTKDKILDMIRAGEDTTVGMAGKLQMNRCSVYRFANMLADDGLIKLVQTGRVSYHWEVV